MENAEASRDPRARIVAVMPVYKDWVSTRHTVASLDAVMRGAPFVLDLVLVDDGSPLSEPWDLGEHDLPTVRSLSIVRLKRNLGHQRAICVGLCHAREHIQGKFLAVMDCDGEDDPKDLLAMVEVAAKASEPIIVFAERRQRSEGAWFRIGYWLFRCLHRVLVGEDIRFGNFSVVPFAFLDALTVTPELWSHYAAAAVTSRLPYTSIPTKRARRFADRSRMSPVDLVAHGLSALSVFSDRIGTRAAIGAAFFLALALVVMLGTAIAGAGPAAAPWTERLHWAPVLGLLQLVTLIVMFCMVVLSRRTGYQFLPIRDYKVFIRAVEAIRKEPS